MGILNINSDLLSGPWYAQTPRDGGVVHAKVFSNPVPVEADIASTLRLGKIPQHGVLLPSESYIQCTATELLTVTLGWEEYRLPDGTVVLADPDGLGTALTIAAGTRVYFADFPAAPLPRTFLADAVITATTAGAAIAAASTVSGVLKYVANF